MRAIPGNMDAENEGVICDLSKGEASIFMYTWIVAAGDRR